MDSGSPEGVRWWGRSNVLGSAPGYAIAGVTVIALLSAAGCAPPEGGGDGEPTSSTGTARAAARSGGPVCVGAAPADGVHVLRGGGFRLPGGGGVQYSAAHVDGTTRTATLRDGAAHRSGQRQWTVRTGAQVTIGGHRYKVRQICSYRVVLEPRAAEDRDALAAAPEAGSPQGGAADDGLCFTTNHAVLTTAENGFPAEGGTLSLLDNGGVQRFPTGLSLTVSFIDTSAGSAGLGANCAAIPVAAYEDVRVGDTVEFADVLFEVSGLTDQAVRLTRTSA
ncbi:hypothetical protein ACL02U_05730 [Streptomyces sp. MS06]|uniref:hypothetical protein n=1 Tax=Streptomyces sp. MS06 TaxID=3385974 RepID=UPI0039A1874B